MGKRKKNSEVFFEKFVQNNYEQVMNDNFKIMSLFGTSSFDDFESGFIAALTWLGFLLNLNLTAVYKDAKQKIDDLIKEVEQADGTNAEGLTGD